MDGDAFARCGRYQSAAADRGHAGPMVRVACGKGDLDEAGSAVAGRGGGEQRTHRRPGTIRADDDVGARGGTVREGEVATALRTAPDGGELVAPPDRLGHQRVDEQAPEFATIHLRT